MVIITFVLCATICCICKYLYDQLRYWHNRGFPCVSTKFNLRQMKCFLLRNKPQEILLKETYDELEGHKFGGYVSLFTPYLLLRDPEIINNVLVRDFGYFEDRFLDIEDKNDTFFENVFAMRGQHWRYVRHKLTPLFSSNKVRLMVDQVVNCCNYAIGRVERDSGSPTDVENLMASYCFSVVGSTVFGLDFDSGEGGDAKKVFLQMIDSFFKPKFLILMTYVLRMGFPRLECYLRKFLRLELGTPETCMRILADSIKMRERTGYRRNDFLQLMIDLKHEEETNESHPGVPKRKISEEEQDYSSKEIFGGADPPAQNFPEKIFTDVSIFANSFLFLSIGTNSTSCVLSFMLYEISINTDIQDRLRKEIDSVLAGENITFECLKQLTYMDKVIAETMRLHIPTGTLVRNCKHDYKIPGTDKIVKRGETVVVMTSAMHHDQQYFQNPEKFDPERFSDVRGISKGVYLPFGCGPRMCFGSY
uniref:Cytochrome P450 CYP3115A1 n=1 Tax=Nilaparvata lugens TaxID=108931 RepID=A0A0K0LB98_NILLU|nr:cytochrome P450 CYP3115A1 [Nilaparvata lugens]